MSTPPTPEPGEIDYSSTFLGLTDADVRQTMVSAIRLLGYLAVVAAALFWWRAGWQSAVLLVLGAAVSAASLWEWLRLITAIAARMDAGHAAPRPIAAVLLGFFMRLGVTLVVLYVSLMYLHGTAFALAAGLGLGVFALTIQALQLMRRNPV